jgi:hypothetical protein
MHSVGENKEVPAIKVSDAAHTLNFMQKHPANHFPLIHKTQQESNT